MAHESWMGYQCKDIVHIFHLVTNFVISLKIDLDLPAHKVFITVLRNKAVLSCPPSFILNFICFVLKPMDIKLCAATILSDLMKMEDSS